jgi:hypothetical protein
MDLPHNFHLYAAIASFNASITSSTTVSTLGDGPIDYFGLWKPAVMGEEWFWSLTELMWGKFEALGVGGLDLDEKNCSLTPQKVPRWYVMISPLLYYWLMFTYCAAVTSAKMNDTHLDRFLVQWVYSPQCTTKHNPTIQHPPYKFDLVLAGAISQYNS